MAWLTRDQFLEKLVRVNLPFVRGLLGVTANELKQYEQDPVQYVKQINQLCETDYYQWEYHLDRQYEQYKLKTVPIWGKLKRIPDTETFSYDWLLFGRCGISMDTTFSCVDAIKWGLRVRLPENNVNLYRIETEFIYELTGLTGTTITLRDIRNHVHHPGWYSDIVCLVE